MRHLRREKHLGRTPSHRQALRRNLACSLLVHGRITTTPAKAKFIQPFVEKLITLARKNTLPGFRRALALLNDKRVVRLLFREIGPKFSDRVSGCTRIIKLGIDRNRLGDNAPQAILELLEKAEVHETADKEKRAAKAKAEKQGAAS
jgi:large subunit ribosomal protein L17